MKGRLVFVGSRASAPSSHRVPPRAPLVRRRVRPQPTQSRSPAASRRSSGRTRTRGSTSTRRTRRPARRQLGLRAREPERPDAPWLDAQFDEARRRRHGEGFRAKNAPHVGNASSVTLADGKKLFAGSSSETEAPPSGAAPPAN